MLFIQSYIYLEFVQQLLNIRACVGTQGCKVPQDVQRKQRRQQLQACDTCKVRAECGPYSPREQSAHCEYRPSLHHLVTKNNKIYPFTVLSSRSQNQFLLRWNQGVGSAPPGGFREESIRCLFLLRQATGVLGCGCITKALCSHCFLLLCVNLPVSSCFKDMNEQ